VRVRDRLRRRRARRRAGPPSHPLLLALCLGALILLLLTQGFSTKTIGAAGTAQGAPGGGSPVAGQSPLLMAQGDRLVGGARPAPGEIALTFDDGPSPAWTPRIAAVLHALRVPATFFVIGGQVVRYPDIVADLHRQGFDLGNHTFTHAQLSSVSDWTGRAQIALTESALAGAAGVRTRVLRPPYSSTPEGVTASDQRAYARAAGPDYLVALSSRDSEDWNRPGVSTIVANATPPGHSGAIVLMHDGGGNRSETLAALPVLVSRLRARGYRFVTLSHMLGLPAHGLESPAPGGARLRGELFVAALWLARWIVAFLTAVVLAVGVLVALRMLAVAFLARRQVRRTRGQTADPTFTPGVSIVVPACNEAVVIARGVSSLAASDYPELETIVVDDGSTDGTADVLERLGLPGVRVVRQANAGKAAALNTGIAAAAHDIVVTVDADTVFEPDTVRRLVQPFRDERVGAVSGNTKVGNRRGLLGRWQHIEYVVGFNLDRRMYETLQCMPTVPGAIGAFRREALRAVGGVSGATLAEDTDLTMAIGHAGWHVVYAQDARAWTEAPATLGALWPSSRCGSTATPSGARARDGSVAAPSPTWSSSRCCCRWRLP